MGRPGRRAQFLHALMLSIREVLRSDEGCVRRNAVELVATFNALTLPRGYLHVAPDGLLHVILVRFIDDNVGGWLPRGVDHSADVIWHFNPATGTWVAVKDRTGEFERMSPIRCGGFPAVKEAR